MFAISLDSLLIVPNDINLQLVVACTFLILIDYFVVDGHWSPWRRVGGCSKTCGGGILQYFRTCTEPLCGGLKCKGISIFEMQCNTACCRGKYMHFLS